MIMWTFWRGDGGFSISELMMVVAVAATLMAVSVPLASDMTASIKLSEAARIVEREFQDARLAAVKANRALRVRTNCPAAGFLRTVEVLGTAADNTTDRCLGTTYPYPPDDNMATRPNYDGPVRIIPNGATATTVTFEFRPDGTVLNVVAGVAQRMVDEQTVTVTRMERSRTARVNGAGKIRLE